MLWNDSIQILRNLSKFWNDSIQILREKKTRIFHTVWVLQGQDLEFVEIHFETSRMLRGNFEVGQSISCR